MPIQWEKVGEDTPCQTARKSSDGLYWVFRTPRPRQSVFLAVIRPREGYVLTLGEFKSLADAQRCCEENTLEGWHKLQAARPKVSYV